MAPSTCRRSIDCRVDQKPEMASSKPASSSAVVGSCSGSGDAGIESWWSSPPASVWNDVIIDRIGLPYWMAWTRRAENDRPSRSRSTAKRIGWLESPGRRK